MPRWSSFDAFLDEVTRVANSERQALADALLQERAQWPWVEDGHATFVYARTGVSNVALSLDTIPRDPPFEPMQQIEGTTLWYARHPFAADDLLDYLLAIDDPMTPLAQETDIVARVTNHWQPDPLNPLRMSTAQTNVSVLRMREARPFPDWSAFKAVPQGRVFEHPIDSDSSSYRGRKLWVYTPPKYEGSGMAYPLLIVQDGQWAIGPLQLPSIADTLIKHRRMLPAVIAMIQSGTQEERNRDYISSDHYYNFLLSELMPFVQTHYRIDSNRVAIGGVAVGAVAAAHAALKNPAVFSRLMLISPPLGKGEFGDELREYNKRFQEADVLPKRIFQSVGRYEAKSRFHKPAHALRLILEGMKAVDYKYVETGSGHGLVGFRSVLPEALAWLFPGDAFGRG
ncbi:MAG: alpha/beta hydrolase-fold protein [Chloroflexota bacterium]